jgi:hypothetical protein
MDEGRYILLNKIVNRLVMDSTVTYDKGEGDDIVITPFPVMDGYLTKRWFSFNAVGSRMPSFKSYVEYTYGIKDNKEIDYIYSSYENIISGKLYGDMINENIYHDIFGEKVSNYMDKVLKYLVSDTSIMDDSSYGDVMITVPFSDFRYNRIRHFNVGFFIDYCKDTYGLTRKESEYLWGDYMNEIDSILKYEFGVKDPVYR